MLDKSSIRRPVMLARAEEGTNVNLLHDMLREERAGRWKEGRIVREVFAMSNASNCGSRPAKREGETLSSATR